MFDRIADNHNQNSLATKLRRKRFAFFQSLLRQLERPLHILDIGGAEKYWKMMEFDAGEDVFITLLNLTAENVTLPYVTSISGDARNIHANDKSFDVVYSNSVIEHVGRFHDQAKMAQEVYRVGRCYFIQTPNKYFPLEPHFLFPFFQFMPIAVRELLLRNFNLGWMQKTPDRAEARDIIESIRLLSRQEFKVLFPTAQIYEEKVFGLTKSFVAYGGWGDGNK